MCPWKPNKVLADMSRETLEIFDHKKFLFRKLFIKIWREAQIRWKIKKITT